MQTAVGAQQAQIARHPIPKGRMYAAPKLGFLVLVPQATQFALKITQRDN